MESIYKLVGVWFFAALAIFWAFLAVVFANQLIDNWDSITTIAAFVCGGFGVVLSVLAVGTFAVIPALIVEGE